MDESKMLSLFFKRALKAMLDNGEMKKSYRHKRKVRRIAKTLTNIENNFNGGIEGMPAISLITLIDDAELWQNILLYMAGEVYTERAND